MHMIRAILLAITLPAVAAAQQPPVCRPTDDVVATLQREYGEQMVGAGMIDPRHVLVVFASREGSTWTLAIIGADGVTCAITGGTGWLYLDPVPEGVPG